MSIASDLLQRHHVTWFLGAVENFRFVNPRVYPLADPEAAVAEVSAEATIKATRRIYRQDYVVILRAVGGKIAFLREYFDPVRAAQALDVPILASNHPAGQTETPPRPRALGQVPLRRWRDHSILRGELLRLSYEVRSATVAVAT